jgi:hypothetical protein
MGVGDTGGSHHGTVDVGGSYHRSFDVVDTVVALTEVEVTVDNGELLFQEPRLLTAIAQPGQTVPAPCSPRKECEKIRTL